jgi:hypothetical protein
VSARGEGATTRNTYELQGAVAARDVRICLAALTLDELAAVGSAIRAVVDRLVTG